MADGLYQMIIRLLLTWGYRELGCRDELSPAAIGAALAAQGAAVPEPEVTRILGALARVRYVTLAPRAAGAGVVAIDPALRELL